jgi:hypothetical protein
MMNPGLTIDLTLAEKWEREDKGWIFTEPQPGKKPKSFIAIEPFPDDRHMLGPTMA